MRHGTLTAARECKCPPCNAEQARYKRFWRRRRAAGVSVKVSVEPSLRKVRALNRLGHTRASIAAEMGTSPQSLSNLLGRSLVKARTEARIEEVYQRLEMRIPPDTRESRRTRAEAEKAGWPAPMAYDDIQAGILAGGLAAESVYTHSRFDEDEIEYAMQYHDFTRKLSPAEKSEIVRRWTADGRSERSLCQLTGWREGRYRVPRPTHQEAS